MFEKFCVLNRVFLHKQKKKEDEKNRDDEMESTVKETFLPFFCLRHEIFLASSWCARKWSEEATSATQETTFERPELVNYHPRFLSSLEMAKAGTNSCLPSRGENLHHKRRPIVSFSSWSENSPAHPDRASTQRNARARQHLLICSIKVREAWLV